MIDIFKKDVNDGLSSSPKYLSSKYFYDAKGDALFKQIMDMPEYYLTDSEMEIFTHQTTEIIESLNLKKETPFELIELGAGDGRKTIKLLQHLTKNEYTFDYIPIDISQSSIDALQASLFAEIPQLSILPRQGDYFYVLSNLMQSNKPKVVLFIGSNMGNMKDEDSKVFISSIAKRLNENDHILLGVDLIKSKDIVLPAYNDVQGITKAFNMNLLHRINRELGGDFKVEQFEHSPEYNEETGLTKSYIKSKVDQTVTILSLSKSYVFLKGEKIQTETSRKYNDSIIAHIISKSDLVVKKKFLDLKEYFADYILMKK